MVDKNNITNLDTSAITAEAASWIAQLDGEDMSNADRLALREWARRSPKHMSELRRLGSMWFDIDAVLQAEINELDVLPSFGRAAVSAFKVKPRAAYGLTAMVATVLFSGVMLFTQTSPNLTETAPVQIAYTVPAGQDKVFNLDDGSVIHANTDSYFEIEYGANQRIVRLVRGEAHFDVAHDENRPFLVYAGGNVLRAVGTAFAIKIGMDETSVIVTEGKVELNSLRRGTLKGEVQGTSRQEEAEPALLSAGESIVITPAKVNLVAEVMPLSEDLIDKKLAWREGLIIFEGESLSEVVDEISRYTEAKIVISDPEIRSIPIGGAFPAGKVDALLGALETSFGVTVEQVSNDVIYLKKSTGQ